MYIGIEGSSYVGKTTTGKVLRDRGYQLIPEYDTFGPFPARKPTLEGQLWVADSLLDRERVRSMMLGNIATGQLVVADRTPLSFITFEDMMIHMSKSTDEKAIHQQVREHIINRIVRDVQIGDIVFPDMVAVLSVSALHCFQSRVQLRGVTPVSALARFDVQNMITEQSLKYSIALLGHDRVKSITVDAKSAIEVTDEFESFVEAATNVESFKEVTINNLTEVAMYESA